MRSFLRQHGWWLALFLAADVALVAFWWRHRDRRADEILMPAPQPEQALMAHPADLAGLSFPTRQTRLADTNYAGVFQPTASGNPESGTYGSVRTGQEGKYLVARFHEGIDIAALERDRQGRPLDDVFAAAAGTVALLNHHAGNSDYGKYVVLTHHDPVGPLYTLYAHLAAIDPLLVEGAVVPVGARLGRMGNTALDPIPMARAHLHFEVGLLNNSRFLSWPGRRKSQAPGGLYNGQNLLGINPILVFRDHGARPDFTLLAHLKTLPAAFELIVASRHLPDYFERHPQLWEGGAYAGRALVLSVAEGGLPLRGRNATEEELHRLGRSTSHVLRVDPAVLGRNGRRLIVQRQGTWGLGRNGENWLGILLHR
jgi:murein DD-endopeptidase MepM/ murein hydrolase activator NlpD